MHSQELLEVAGLLAAHARCLTSDQPEIPEQSLVDYWVASRTRFDAWSHDLRLYSIAATKSPNRPLTPRLYRLAVEIEASEVLARTLAALGHTHDTVHNRNETSPITGNILAAHRDVARRLNEVIASRDGSAFRDVLRFRNLRRQLHQLTDQLVACFLPLAQVGPFAHNPRLVVELGEAAANRISRGAEAADWATLSRQIAGLRHECGEAGPNARDNHQVAAAAMSFFAPEMFDSYGLLRTTWLRRLERTESETSVLIDEWLNSDAASAAAVGNRILKS